MNPNFMQRKISAYREYASTLTHLYLDEVISGDQYRTFIKNTKSQYDAVKEEIRRNRYD